MTATILNPHSLLQAIRVVLSIVHSTPHHMRSLNLADALYPLCSLACTHVGLQYAATYSRGTTLLSLLGCRTVILAPNLVYRHSSIST